MTVHFHLSVAQRYGCQHVSLGVNDDINDMPFTTLLSAQIAEW